MLDLILLRDHPDRVRQALIDKGIGTPALVDEVLAADERRRAAQTEAQALQEQLNALSREIGPLMKAGNREQADDLRSRSTAHKEQIKRLEQALKEAEALQHRLLLEIPNLPHPTVPIGRTPDDNVVAAELGTPPAFSFTPKPHWELAAQHGLLDFERGAKVAGAGFPFYLGAGARLQRALIAFFLDEAAENGYLEIQPPLVINAASGVGTGQLPDKEDQMYEAPKDGLYLIPTAEVPVMNFHREEILDERLLPLKYAAYTPCFRREAGSYGKDVRGLNRLHQFDKVELVQFVHPEQSYEALESLREDAESLLTKLGLPYRRLLMCTGDMGFTQSKKYDLEVWSAGQGRWLEVSSISNFEAFQARRAQIRYRPSGGGKPQFLHTLNGSGLALPRIVASLLENGQDRDGGIRFPAVLHRYLGVERLEAVESGA